MARKKTQRVDIAKQWRWERLCKAPLIKEKWPHVAKLTLEFAYQDIDWPSHASEAKNIERTPNHQAFFDYDCPYRYFQGGFEITGAVSRRLNRRRPAAQANSFAPDGAWAVKASSNVD